MADGLLRMAVRLAFVMASMALTWLYGFDIRLMKPLSYRKKINKNNLVPFPFKWHTGLDHPHIFFELLHFFVHLEVFAAQFVFENFVFCHG